MAALSITETSVAEGSNAKTKNVIIGATLTAGMAVYEDTADSFHVKATVADAVATAKCAGILLNGGADGQRSIIQYEGTVNGLGATEGVAYFALDSGGIGLLSDLAADDYVTYLGIGNSAGGIDLNIHVTTNQVQS